ARPRPSPLTTATIDLIRRMARDNPLWGAERIRGEVHKLSIRVSKRTIQKCLRHAPRSRPCGQNWRTFLRNHAGEIWACDFLQVTDLFFSSLFAFFIIELRSRKVIHVGVTRSPTDAWTAQHLREATPYGLLTPVYNCAQIKLTVPRDGCSLWEMPFIISAGDSHDQEQDSEQNTRLSSSRQIDSRHRDPAGDCQKYGAQIPAPPRAGRHAASAAQSPLQTRSVQRPGAAVDHRRPLLQL